MAARYVPLPKVHGLSAEAELLDPERLTVEALVAESVLGLDRVTLSGDDAERAKSAVARQVNLQLRVAKEPDLKAESRGHQSVTYATVGGVRVIVDATAKAIADKLIGPPRETSASTPNAVVW